jgi:hypothetical protein
MSEKSVVCPILAGIWFDDADGQYQEFLVDEVEVVLDPLKDQLVQFQISQEELGEFRARNQPVGKVTGVGLLTRDTKPLREGLDADSRAMPLLRRMQKIRDLRELALDEGAWDNYQKTRASWMKQQLKFGTVSEDQVEEAFDEWWQDTLDGLEESSPTAIDALGRPVHDNGAP